MEDPNSKQSSSSPEDVTRSAFAVGDHKRRSLRKLALWISIPAILIFTSVGLYSARLSHVIDRQLAAGPFAGSIEIFSAPGTAAVGDALNVEETVAKLRRNGYTQNRGNTVGWYNIRGNILEIFPGRDTCSVCEPALLEVSGGKISRIVSLQDNTERKICHMPPELIASLSEGREMRSLVRFSEIPDGLKQAIISAEDKRFFRHAGVDPLRVFKAAYVDLKHGRKQQGASTLSMQLARGLWLERDKSWARKLREILMALRLEDKLTKEDIFEYYANQVYLGRRGPFSINGFREGARVFFGKDLTQVGKSEAALLAGLVQRPSSYDPYRFPERARARRNLVLSLMRQNGFVSDAEFQQLSALPLNVIPENSDAMGRQYFLDLAVKNLSDKLDDRRGLTRYIYTTLDPELQRAAEAAISAGIEQVDGILRKRKRTAPIPVGQPQVALVALDPRTGEVKALAGGRDYARSQLNRAVALRQPGSVFKPFVYAAALNTALQGDALEIFTPASILVDEPTSFFFGAQAYQPKNFSGNFEGEVTLRTALVKSLNVPTVQLAEDVGLSNVVAMARRMGLNEDIQPTPAVALGAYETTPLEIAQAYAVFANNGKRVTLTAVSLVRAADGEILYQPVVEQKQVLDSRVAFLVTDMMQDVLQRGTGAAVRSRGFALPAAGKTGTSRDGWFAGFTSELVCVVWVGFDDGSDLNLEGSRSALPIWTEFMKRASLLPQYREAKPFPTPSGIVSREICQESGKLAGDRCTRIRQEFFIDGAEPLVACEVHGSDGQSPARAIVHSVFGLFRR